MAVSQNFSTISLLPASGRKMIRHELCGLLFSRVPTIPGMAAIARMSLKDAQESIDALCAPDPHSRSKEYDGRRLIETDGGWLIVNYAKYRQKRDPEKRREQNRKAQERFRSKQKVSQSKPK